MTSRPLESDGRAEMLSMPPRPRLSLCMIVRDNASTIEPCLESIRPWVDEMIVVDTGSVDETPEICRRMGAKVFSFPWIDDFSAARNESLRHATGEWLFWMDSDDTIDEANGRKLREAANSNCPDSVLGFVMQVHCPGPDDELTVVDHVKLFRNRPEIRFEGRIHEQVIRSIRTARGIIAWSDAFVLHSGSDVTAEGKAKKIERDLRILKKDFEERPEHPFVLFNLGMTYNDAQDHELAVDFLKRCLSASPWEQSHVRKAYALLVMSLTQLERISEAVEVCSAGRKLYPLDAELLFRQGILAMEMGQFPEAVAAFRGAMRSREPRHFSSLDPGITGYKARNNLALAHEKLSQHDQAELHWRIILAERPGFRPAWRGLGESLLASERRETLRLEIEQRRKPPVQQAASLVLEAKLHQACGAPGEARACLERAAREFPADPQCQEALSQLHVCQGEWAMAETTLSRLTELIPDDGAAWHNLAHVVWNLGQRERAIAALEQSLRVRPYATHTQSMLKLLKETTVVEAA
jgi:tetratricopeptide (TPR) repeat protein